MSQTKTHTIYGLHAVQAALAGKVRGATLWVDAKRQDTRIQACVEQAKAQHIPVQQTDKTDLNNRVAGRHQGVVLSYLANDVHVGDEKSLHAFLQTLTHPPLLLVLDGVTDPHNLGACLRTANGAGVDAVISPKDKSARLTAVAVKVACGAAQTTPFFQVTNLARALRQLADDGIWLIGTDDKAEQDIYQSDLKGPLALVLGSEGSGLRRLTKETCQQLVSIPMQGTVQSLNVSVAAGVVLYEACRQR